MGRKAFLESLAEVQPLGALVEATKTFALVVINDAPRNDLAEVVLAAMAALDSFTGETEAERDARRLGCALAVVAEWVTDA